MNITVYLLHILYVYMYNLYDISISDLKTKQFNVCAVRKQCDTFLACHIKQLLYYSYYYKLYNPMNDIYDEYEQHIVDLHENWSFRCKPL